MGRGTSSVLEGGRDSEEGELFTECHMSSSNSPLSAKYFESCLLLSGRNKIEEHIYIPTCTFLPCVYRRLPRFNFGHLMIILKCAWKLCKIYSNFFNPFTPTYLTSRAWLRWYFGTATSKQFE
jgi:hypothetical protein